MSYGYWSRQFGRDKSVLGRTISVNGSKITVVGVAKYGFFGLSVGLSPDIWMPLSLQPLIKFAGDLRSNLEVTLISLGLIRRLSTGFSLLAELSRTFS